MNKSKIKLQKILETTSFEDIIQDEEYNGLSEKNYQNVFVI